MIRVDQNNYFYDSRTNTRLEEYDPFNENLCFKFKTADGYYLQVDHEKIKVNKFGICFDYNGKTFVIDDNHQQVLSYVAYIINDQYTNKIEQDTSRGLYNRDAIFKILHDALTSEFKDCSISNIDTKSLNYYINFRLGETEGKLCFQTISNVVNVNKLRWDLNLPYYPYIRGIDRYNAYYMTIWNNDNGSLRDNMSYDIFLNELIEKMNASTQEYQFSTKILQVNSRIIRVRDDLVPATIE